jgi:hypothetical protein
MTVHEAAQCLCQVVVGTNFWLMNHHSGPRANACGRIIYPDMNSIQRSLGVEMLLVVVAFSAVPDDLSDHERMRCGKDSTFVKENYGLCCGMGRYMARKRVCARAWEQIRPKEDHDIRSPSWPKIRSTARSSCIACVRLVDNFEMGLLPALHKRHGQLRRSHSSSRFAHSATVGELEAIVEHEVERICNWPRTHHDPLVRRACISLVEEQSEALVAAVSSWARGLSMHSNILILNQHQAACNWMPWRRWQVLAESRGAFER